MRKLRVLKNYSQEYVAEVIKIDVSTYARYEKGETQIKFEQAVKLADLYNLTLDQFYHYDDPEFRPVVKDPTTVYSLEKTKRTVTVSIELDGEKSTVDFWIDKIRKLNAAIA